MITAFQQGRNRLIISKIFKVMVYTALSCGKSWKWGWRKKRRFQISAKRFSGQLSWPSQIKTCTFSKPSRMAVRKDKTMAKPLCASGGQILLNPSTKWEKQLEKVALQPACSSWDTFSKQRDTWNPFSWLWDQAWPPCCFLPFPTTPQDQDPCNW